MPQYLVAIHRPANYDGTTESEEMRADISALNEDMKKAGIIAFVGGLRPETEAKTLWHRPDGRVRVTDGPYLETKEFIGGFWVLNCASEEEAVEWGKKASKTCRAPVEVRGFW